VRTFIKSEAFGGIIFAKCTSTSHRDILIESIRNAPQSADSKPWANIDQPINVRTAESVLFAFKRMLVDWGSKWGFNKNCVWVDRETRTLFAEGKEVMKTHVEDLVLKIRWCDGKWEGWSELQTATEFTALKSSAQEKLDRVKELKGKGETKGSAQ